MELPVNQPKEKFKTVDNFIKWYDERTYGSEQGSLGLKRGTEGKLIQYEEFSTQAKGLQSK